MEIPHLTYHDHQVLHGRGPWLSDSMFKPRPSSSVFFTSDASGSKDAIQETEERRRRRLMKFPSLHDRKDVDSFKFKGEDPPNPTDSAYKKWNDAGDYRSDGPHRSCDNIIDPVSGFVSVAGDVDRGTGHHRIKSMVQLSHTPQSLIPQEVNSVRAHCQSAPPELTRMTEKDDGTPYEWNQRKILDGVIRGQLGGWTSEKDPRKVQSKPEQKTENQILRDRLALQYMYTSSTQKAYEDIPWEKMAGRRIWPPTTTLEQRPDMISHRFNTKRYDPPASEWQKVVPSWDSYQMRKSYDKTDISRPIPGTVFCSPNPRHKQIPGYSGCIGAANIDEIDNANEPFQPFTIKRVLIPTPTDTSQRIPVSPNTSPFKRDSQMSRMVTTVPPCNPFNKIESSILKVERVPNKAKKNKQENLEAS